MQSSIENRVSQIIYKRFQIRYRAAVIAEHLFDIKCLIGQCDRLAITEGAWKESVTLIEYHIIKDEAPYLEVVDITDFWGPVWAVLGPSNQTFNPKPETDTVQVLNIENSLVRFDI